MFNCDKKRKHTYTAFNTFKKFKYSEYRDCNQKIPYTALQEEFENLPEDDKESYEIIARRHFDRSQTLWDELKVLLLKTKGKIGYKTMADQLGEKIVSQHAIHTWLTSRVGFKMRKDRILPSLDPAARERRVVWGESFWLFWKSAAAVT